MSEYQNKSKMCEDAANNSHSKAYYAAVGHTAYYCCFLLAEHIFYHTLSKTKAYLYSLCDSTEGSHEVIINDVVLHIKKASVVESNLVNDKIAKLKRLRISADYKDEAFGKDKADASIRLMTDTLSILSKY